MDSRASTLRHAVFGAVNALSLSTRALELSMSVTDQVEFLDDIVSSSDQLVNLLDQYEAIGPLTTAE